MSKLAILGATFALAGCASTSEWRTLTIDGIPVSDYRPGGQFWPTGADARGRAEYQNHQ